MKATTSKLVLLAMVSTALAVPMQPFSDWESVIQRSPDIILARCTQTPARSYVQPDGVVLEFRDGILHSDIMIESVLKGVTNCAPAWLSSRYWPRQGELYLIFSTRFEGLYHATESYRVIPLGMGFPTNVLSGQSLHEQIRTVFNYRLHELGRELQQRQEEKKRLEQGLRELKP
jgi:hypothetical protein